MDRKSINLLKICLLYTSIEKQGNKTSFEITKMGTNTWMQIPVTYYKGYTAATVDTNGKQFKLPVIKNKDSGLVEVNNKLSLIHI